MPPSATADHRTGTLFDGVRPDGRRPILWLTGVVIGLLVAATAGIVWHERQQALQLAESTAARRANRLAKDLAQSLAIARRAIDQAEALRARGAHPDSAQDELAQQQALLSALDLPLVIRKSQAQASAPSAALHWQAGLPERGADGPVLPLTWAVQTLPGGDPRVYRADLALDALQRRLEQDRAPPGGGASLFRLDPDGLVTVLARAPFAQREQGLRISGWLAQTLAAGERGVFSTPGVIDGIARRAAFQRLPAPADSLVVAYGFAADDVLATGRDRWMRLGAFAALLALALGWGGWRLDRSQSLLARNAQRLRLALASGQIWEWDLESGVVCLPESLWQGLGYPMPDPQDMRSAFTDMLWPEDRAPLNEALRRHVRDRAPLVTEFRLRDAQGQAHWFSAEGQADWNAQGRAVYMAGTVFETTERHRLEEEQRQILRHLDTVANASASLSWTVDVHQRPDWLNQAWLDFTGRDMASECEAFWLDDVHPQDRERCARVFDEAFEKRKPYSMEYRLLRHDGQYRWLHEQGQPRYDADHRFIGYVGSCLDVTDLREAEATAREHSTMLRQVFDVLQDMLFVVDAQERFIFFEAGTGEGLYRAPQDFLGRPIAEVMPPELVTEFQAAMQMARRQGLQEILYSLPMPDGTHHFTARLAWLPDGERCMFLVRDVTEQQLARQSREHLNDFVLLLFRLATRFINLPLQQMDEAVDAALRDMGEFLHVDRTYLFTYDHPAGTSTNTHEWCSAGVEPQKHLYQNAPIGPLDDWYTLHRSGQKIQVTDTTTLPQGSLRKLLERMSIRSVLTLPLMDAGTCRGFVGLDVVGEAREYGQEEITLLELFAQMLVNMQLRAQAAEQVREMTEQLEQKVKERTQQLNESVQRLQAVNRELESFNYSASHDLRTPLRGIEGFSSLLLEEHAQQLDEQGKEYLRRIQRATLHMSQLVSDLLAYSRLQQMTERIEPVNVKDCVEQVLMPFQDELTARHGQVVVDIPEGLCVRATAQGLSIVLRNLLDNALKFTPAGQVPQIRIDARTEDTQVLLGVADRGMGFDMKHHDRIFDMFQRLHRQDQIPGTGIGLALVHKAVERMGGKIRADSAPGQGARFEISLPRA